MTKLNVSTLASLAAILSASAAFAATGAPLANRDADYMHWMDNVRSAQTKQAVTVVQDGNYAFALDAEWGTPNSAVAVWDGYAPGLDRAESAQASTVIQDGSYAFVLDAKSGAMIRAGAVWDGHAQVESAPGTMTLVRLGSIAR